MLNELAGKLFGYALGKNTIEEEAGQVENLEDMATTTVRDEVDDNNFDEWVLLDDDASDCGSLSDDELDGLVLAPLRSVNTSNCPSPLSTVDSLGWKLAPPACFAQAPPAKGQNKYKHVKHRNPNLLRSVTNGVSKTPNMEVSMLSNMLIEHPLSLSVYQKQRRRPAMAMRQKLVEAEKVSADTKPIEKVVDENQENQAPKSGTVVESKAVPVYVVTGIDVCEKPPVAAVAPSRIEVRSAEAKTVVGDPAKRRPKRQHFTLYDAAVFNNGNRGKQRKDLRC